MKLQYDARMHTRECDINIGSKVLLKRERVNKAVSPWDPDTYEVTHMKGSLVTARRSYPFPHETTRNSSFFKPFRYDEDEEPSDEPVVIGESESLNEERKEMHDPISEAQATSTTQNIVSVPIKKKMVGRPSVHQAKLNEQERKRAYEERRAANPALRVSSRKAKKQN